MIEWPKIKVFKHEVLHLSLFKYELATKPPKKRFHNN